MEALKRFLRDFKDGIGQRLRYEHASISKALHCAVCCTPALNPVEHRPCSQLFCRRCAELQIATTPFCPNCREPIVLLPGRLWRTLAWMGLSADPQSDKSVLSAPGPAVQLSLDSLVVACPGCPATLPRVLLEDHLKRSCLQPCPRSCGSTIALADERMHEMSCPEVPVRCPAAAQHCTFYGPRKALSAHVATCAVAAVQPALLGLQGKLSSLEAVVKDLQVRLRELERKQSSNKNN